MSCALCEKYGEANVRGACDCKTDADQRAAGRAEGLKEAAAIVAAGLIHHSRKMRDAATDDAIDMHGSCVKALSVTEAQIRALMVRPAVTRLEAAEKAVAAAALVVSGSGLGGNAAELTAFSDACARLRDLLGNVELCGAVTEVRTHDVFRTDTGSFDDSYRTARVGPVECRLPRDHDGEHSGVVSDWSWP